MKQLRSISLLIATTLLSTQAHAEFAMHSPEVEKGVFEIEFKNSVIFDSDSENRSRDHTVALGYGINEWWKLEVEGEWEKPHSEGTTYEATVVENIFELFPAEHYCVGAGLQLSYVFAHEPQTADGVEVALLLEKETGQFSHTANIGVGREIGEWRGDATEFEIAWGSRFNYLPSFNPGFEYYGSVENARHAGNWSDQDHRVGPVASGELAEGFGYELGWLVGVSKGAADHTLKLNLEYELPI